MRARGHIVVLVLLFAGLPMGGFAQEPAAVDPATGLASDERLELVRANCTGCHSAGLITRARLSRDDWLEAIRWMQHTQNLWPFPPATENQLLDYLVQHYGPREQAPRRRALARHLRPPGRDRPTPPD